MSERIMYLKPPFLSSFTPSIESTSVKSQVDKQFAYVNNDVIWKVSGALPPRAELDKRVSVRSLLYQLEESSMA